MAGQGEQVDVHGLDVNGQVSGSLHGVGMEQHAVLLADCADFRNGLNGAHFVIGKHNRDQAGIGPDGSFHLLRRHQTFAAHVQKGHLEALLLQALQAVENGVMLKGGGDDVHFPLLFP